MKLNLTHEHKKVLDDLILNRKYKSILIEKTKKFDNECMINAFFKAGIVEFDEVIQAIWSIAKEQSLNSVEKDDKGYSGLVYIWKNIPLSELLNLLELEEDEFTFEKECPCGENLYFKIRYDPKRCDLVIISLHVARW